MSRWSEEPCGLLATPGVERGPSISLEIERERLGGGPGLGPDLFPEPDPTKSVKSDTFPQPKSCYKHMFH